MQRPLKYVIILILCFCRSSAQRLPFKTYTSKEGLISNEITGVIRDDRGLLWIGTPFGINWYDGNHFTEPEIKTVSGQLYVTKLLKDNKQNIWVLSFYNGLYKFNKDGFSNFLPNPLQIEANSNSVLDMVPYDDSTFIVATDNNIFWFDGATFSEFDKTNRSLGVQFNTIGYAKDKWLFFGNSHGIIVYRREKNHWKFEGKVFTDHEINKILINREQAWISTSKGLLFFDQVEDILDNSPAKKLFANKYVSGITKNEKTGDLWISSDRLYRINENGQKAYGIIDGLPAIPGYVYFDQENIAWFCSGKGLTKLVQENSVFYDLRTGPSHSMITMIAKNDKETWLGTFDGIALKTNETFTSHRSAQGQNIGYVSWLLKTSTNVLLAGTHLGLLSVTKDNMIIKNRLKTTKAFEDSEGILWVGTELGKLFALRNDTLSAVEIEDPVIDYIDALYRDKNGNTWVGYRTHGIRKYSDRKNHTPLKLSKEYSSQTGFPDLRIRCSFVDKSGNLLFGTRTKGVFIVSGADNNKTWSIGKEKGLSADWVRSIASDASGTIYLVTNKGVNVLRGDYDNPSIIKINLVDEELTDKATFIFPDEEKLWIGTENGIVEYKPGIHRSDTSLPVIYFTELTVNGKGDTSFRPYVSSVHRKFNTNQHIIAFEFTGIDFRNDVPLHYRYMLEGQDTGWTYAGQRNFVSYNLPAGKYSFKVQCKNPLGNWSHPATCGFTIPSPFWKRWWFLTGIVVLVAVVIFLVYRYRLGQVLKLEKLRSRISTDLHDDIGSTLSSISILSEMAAQEKDRQQSSEMMQEINQNSVSLMEKMDDIVWSINPRNDSIEDLMLRIKRFASGLFEAKDIDYVIQIDDSIRTARLNMESRQHIYLIMKEAINNLVKYADCTRAIIEVKYRQGLLNIEIRDNGKGFNEHNIRSGNGMISMRKRAEAISGTIRIASTKDVGTTISLQTKIK